MYIFQWTKINKRWRVWPIFKKENTVLLHYRDGVETVECDRNEIFSKLSNLCSTYIIKEQRLDVRTFACSIMIQATLVKVKLYPLWPDWAIYWTLGNFSKCVATISLPKSLTFLGNFCNGVKIYHFWLTFIDIWRFFLVALIIPILPSFTYISLYVYIQYVQAFCCKIIACFAHVRS